MALPARAFGRPASTCGTGAGPERGAPSPRRRRAGLGPRRIGAGFDHQPANGPSARPSVLVLVHRARSLDRRVLLRSGGGDVSGEDRRGGKPSRALRSSKTSVHAVALVRGRRTRSQGATIEEARG